MDRLELDSVPAVMVLWLAVLLVVIWSIETLEQPNLQPYGPARHWDTGGSFTQVVPPVRRESVEGYLEFQSSPELAQATGRPE